MIETAQIVEIVFKAIDEVNSLLPSKNRLEKSLEAQLTGDDGKLDSLNLVNFIVALEQRLEEDLHMTLSLAQEETMSLKQNPFETVTSLITHIRFLIEKNYA